MDTLKELSLALIWLIRIGVVVRTIYCFIRMAGNDEEAGVYTKRIKNVILFYIFSESVWQLRDIIIRYFYLGG